MPYSKPVLNEEKHIFLFVLVNIVILNGPTTVVHVIFFTIYKSLEMVSGIWKYYNVTKYIHPRAYIMEYLIFLLSKTSYFYSVNIGTILRFTTGKKLDIWDKTCIFPDQHLMKRKEIQYLKIENHALTNPFNLWKLFPFFCK